MGSASRGQRGIVPGVLTAVAVLVAACGSSGPGSAPTAAHHRPSASTARRSSRGTASSGGTAPYPGNRAGVGSGSSRAAPTAAEVQQANAINLVASDFPSGWTQSATPSPAGASQTTSAFQACAGPVSSYLSSFVASPVFVQTPPASSPSATTGGVEAGSLVSFTSTATEAAQVVPYLTSASGTACVRNTIRDAYAHVPDSTIQVTGVAVSATTQHIGGVAIADVDVSFSVHIAEGAGFDEPVHEVIDAFTKGNALVELYLIDLPASDQALGLQLLAGLVQRA